MRVSDREALAMLRRGRRDPVWFIKNVLGQTPTSYQENWLEALRDNARVSIATAHNTGKSKAASMAAVWFFLTHPYSEVVTTAPTARQVKKILWKEIRRLRKEAKIPFPIGGELTTTEWRLDRKSDGTSDWFMTGYTAPKDDPDRFQGLHSKSGHNLVIVDEASGISETIYNEGIESIMSAPGSKCLLIGNPTSPTGEFHDSQKPDSDYAAFRQSAYDTPNFLEFGIRRKQLKDGSWKKLINGRPMPVPFLVNPAWAAGRLRKWGPSHPQFLARVEAKSPTSGEHALIPMWAIDEACDRKQDRSGGFRLGVDPGGEGADPSIVGRAYESGHYRKVYQEAKTKLTELAHRIAITVRSKPAKPMSINIDNIGLGLAVYQELRDEVIWDEIRGRRVPICKADGAASPVDKYAFDNRRAEMYWNLRRLFEEGVIDIDSRDSALIEELSQIRWAPTKSGKVLIESKREFKRRVGKSPDNADAMAYAFAELSEHDFVTVTV